MITDSYSYKNRGIYMINLHELQGKTIGIIYTFEGENALGFEHYHVWQSDIIAKWLEAVQDLKCRPLILDVRTFVQKAIYGTLPMLDFVLNLNCGGIELSPMAVVPSICSFLHIPCIPCNAVAILSGENKLISNLLAKAVGIRIPQTLSTEDKTGIFRPLNLGSSIGVKRGPNNQIDGIYQEFIPGYDITTPIVYNPAIEKMDFMPTVVYISEEDSIDWFLNEDNKGTRQGFKRKTLFNLDSQLKNKYLELVESMSINTFCRIDARIRCNSIEGFKKFYDTPLTLDDIYFIEINPMPTVWINNAFSHSFSEITSVSSFHPFLEELKAFVPNCTLHNFLLSIGIVATQSQVKK